MRKASNLWREFDLELPGEILPLKLLVFPDVGADHASNLLLLQEQTQSKVVDAGIVAHHRQVLHVGLEQAGDQVLGDPAQPET